MNQRPAQPKSTIKASEHTVIQYMTGPSRKGPKRCLHCYKVFKRGEGWQRNTSPEDPKYGSYVIGIHLACMGKSHIAA